MQRKKGTNLKKNLFKKISAILIAAVMVLAMASTAFAGAGTDGKIGTSDDTDTITVQGVTDEGVTVKAYPIVLATYDGNGNFKGYEKVNGYDITNINQPTVAELSNIADIIHSDAFNSKDNKTVYTLTDVNNSKVYTANVPVGMYLVLVEGASVSSYNPAVASVYYASNGQANSMVTEKVNFDADGTLGSTTFVKKSGTPSVDKTIVDKTGKDGNNKGGSVNIGDTVKYNVTVSAIPDYRGNHPVLNVVDTLSKGLTYNDDLKITIDNKELTENKDYTLEKTNNADGTTTITVNFVVDNKYTLNAYAKKGAVIAYSATLNEKAEINNSDNNNSVVLNYTKDSKITGNEESDNKTTYTYTFDIDGQLTNGILTKKATDTSSALAGAEFTVYRDAECKTEYTNSYKENNKIFNGVVTSDGSGQLHITGLAAGTYYLKETKAPENYSLNTHVFKVVINAVYDDTTGKLTRWTVTIDDKSTSTFTVSQDNKVTKNINGIDIMNTKLSSLPSTGGMGTYLFTIIGVVVMAGAAGAFFISRRKGSEE